MQIKIKLPVCKHLWRIHPKQKHYVQSGKVIVLHRYMKKCQRMCETEGLHDLSLNTSQQFSVLQKVKLLSFSKSDCPRDQRTQGWTSDTWIFKAKKKKKKSNTPAQNNLNASGTYLLIIAQILYTTVILLYYDYSNVTSL